MSLTASWSEPSASSVRTARMSSFIPLRKHVRIKTMVRSADIHHHRCIGVGNREGKVVDMAPHLDTIVMGISFLSKNFLKSIKPSVNSMGRRPSVATTIVDELYQSTAARVHSWEWYAPLGVVRCLLQSSSECPLSDTLSSMSSNASLESRFLPRP